MKQYKTYQMGVLNNIKFVIQYIMPNFTTFLAREEQQK